MPDGQPANARPAGRGSERSHYTPMCARVSNRGTPSAFAQGDYFTRTIVPRTPTRRAPMARGIGVEAVQSETSVHA